MSIISELNSHGEMHVGHVGIGAIDYIITTPAKITQCEWKSDSINDEEWHATRDPIPL